MRLFVDLLDDLELQHVPVAREDTRPARLSTPLMRTATFGRSAPVAIEVAIALAVSWKPLVKSNASAVTITTITSSDR